METDRARAALFSAEDERAISALRNSPKYRGVYSGAVERVYMDAMGDEVGASGPAGPQAGVASIQVSPSRRLQQMDLFMPGQFLLGLPDPAGFPGKSRRKRSGEGALAGPGHR